MEDLSFFIALFIISGGGIITLLIVRSIRLRQEKKTQVKIALQKAKKNTTEDTAPEIVDSLRLSKKNTDASPIKKSNNTATDQNKNGEENNEENKNTEKTVEKNNRTKSEVESGKKEIKALKAEEKTSTATNTTTKKSEEKIEDNPEEKNPEKKTGKTMNEENVEQKEVAQKQQKEKNNEARNIPPLESEEIKPEEEQQPAVSYKEIAGLMARAEILMSQNSLTEAEKILVQILAYDNNHHHALEKLGEIYLAHHAYSKSAILYENLLLVKPEDPSVHTNYALSLLHQKDLEKSIHHYEQATVFDTDNPERHANLGQVFFTVKNFDDALECFFTASKLSPRKVEYLYLIADTYRNTNRYPESKIWYEKILSITPYDAEAQKEVERLTALGF